MTLAREIKREKISLEEKDDKHNALNDDFFLSRSTLGSPHDNGLRLYFDEDPLVEVVALLRNSYEPYQVHSIISDDQYILDDLRISHEDIEIAGEVRSHFLNKYLMKTLQNHQLTQFQQAVQKVLYEPLTIKANEVGILTKLYPFYVEDKQTEAIIKDAVSIENMYEPLQIDNVVTFAGSVERSARGGKFTRYYWQTASGHLLKVDVQGSERQAWRVVSKAKKIHIRGFIIVGVVSGYWFNVGDLKRSKFEILD